MKITNGKLASVIVILVVIIDQLIKIWVKTHFFYDEEYQITEWFRIHFIENNGMAFGMEFGSKLILTWFRIIAVALFIYYIYKIRNSVEYQRGYIVCVALITAGALGNLIDCIFYGIIFNAPMFPDVATLFPTDGSTYGTIFNGRVVDMFYFPLFEWDWPSFLPFVGGEHFIFFQPIFNFADASLSVAVILVFLFYSKNLANKLP